MANGPVQFSINGLKFMTFPHISRLHENFELLKGRLMSITESKSQLEVDIKRKTQHNRSLISEMNSLKPEIKRLSRQRDQLKK